MEKLNDNGIFIKEFEVLYSQLDNNYELSKMAAINLLQDMAIRHSNYVGYTLQYLKERNLAWLIKGWAIEFKKTIMENDTFTISTWTKQFKKLQAERNFIAKDENGSELFKATSRWFLIDTVKRKPLKIEEEFMKNFLPHDAESLISNVDYKSYKPNTENIVKEYTKNINVENSHLDINYHVNNAAYIGWAMDCIPLEDLNRLKLYRLYSIYVNEVSINDNVLAKCCLEEADGNKIYTIDFVSRDEERTFAQVTLIFQ